MIEIFSVFSLFCLTMLSLAVQQMLVLVAYLAPHLKYQRKYEFQKSVEKIVKPWPKKLHKNILPLVYQDFQLPLRSALMTMAKQKRQRNQRKIGHAIICLRAALFLLVPGSRAVSNTRALFLDLGEWLIQFQLQGLP